MSFEERGIYITLLCAQHQNGHLDTKRVGFLLGLGWDMVPDIVKSKFKTDVDGLIFNQRLDEEIEKRANFIEKQRNNGLKGGRPRKEKTQPESQNKPKQNPNTNPTGNGDANAIDIVNRLIKESFDERYIEQQKMQWKNIDFDFELEAFGNKVIGSPEKYQHHDTGGMRLALQAQLRNAKRIPANGRQISDEKMKKFDAL